MQNISTLTFGLILSFLGQLPLGTMSLTATQIAVQESFRDAWKYSIGVALIEVLYLRLVLSGMQWIVSHPLIFATFNWLTILFFAVLGILSFMHAQRQEKGEKALLLRNRLNRFLLGLSMSALNPAQIPFWFIWTGYFIQFGWLKPDFTVFNFFTIGSGFGTLAGLAVYMYGGNWLVTKMKTSHRTLNKIMGIIFIIAALTQFYRVIVF
jgi:threonine/homoserine/homoserine lactone efflux protein